jgi:hypothetical protein
MHRAAMKTRAIQVHCRYVTEHTANQENGAAAKIASLMGELLRLTWQ